MMDSRHSRRWVLAAATTALATAGAVVFSVPASALVTADYQPSFATPALTVTNQHVTGTLVFKNNTESVDILNAAQATFRPEFRDIAPASPVGSSGGLAGTSWTVSVSGGTVSLVASSLGGTAVAGVGAGGEVSVAVSFTAPSSAGTYALTTAAQGVVNGLDNSSFMRSGDDPTVVVTTGGVATCNSAQACDTGEVGSPQDTLGRVVSYGGQNADVVTITVTPNPGTFGSATCQGKQSLGQVVGYTTEDLSRKVLVMMELDKHYVPSSSAKSGKYDDDDKDDDRDGDGERGDEDEGSSPPPFAICYQSKTPFSTASGASSVQAGAFWYGLLPRCYVTHYVAPCLYGVFQTRAGDIRGYYKGQAGDPGGVWQK